jgi:hypothetical protein
LLKSDEEAVTIPVSAVCMDDNFFVEFSFHPNSASKAIRVLVPKDQVLGILECDWASAERIGFSFSSSS